MGERRTGECSAFAFGSEIWVATKCLEGIGGTALAGNVSPACKPRRKRVVTGRRGVETEVEAAGSTPGVETASSGQTCRQSVSSFQTINTLLLNRSRDHWVGGAASDVFRSLSESKREVQLQILWISFSWQDGWGCLWSFFAVFGGLCVAL